MKKILSILPLFVVMLLLTSCGGPSPKSVYEKIEGGEELTAKDYDTMIDYCISALDDLYIMFDKAKNKEIEPADIENEYKDLNEKYPYADKFSTILNKGNIPEACNDRYKKLEDKQKDVQNLLIEILTL